MEKCFSHDTVGKNTYRSFYKKSELRQDFSAVCFAALKRGYGMGLNFHRYGQGGEGKLELL